MQKCSLYSLKKENMPETYSGQQKGKTYKMDSISEVGC